MNHPLPVVTLRALEPEDLDSLYGIENDPECWDVGVTNVPYSRYLLHDYIAGTVGDIYTDKQLRLMIENEEKTVVGIVDLMNFDPRHLRAELGLVIQRVHRHQGYAHSVISTICRYAKEVLHLHQLYVIIPADNLSTLSIFQHAGFHQTAELNDWLFDGTGYHPAIMLQRII